MRHHKWDEIMGFLDDVARHFSTSIYDKRAGRTWDVGQAVCAEAYGPDWMHNKTFIKWSNKDDSEPPEPHYYNCAKRMAQGYKPGWMEKKP